MVNTISYKNNISVPQIGLGTFKLQGKIATRTIIRAYELGYRLIDTATLYCNHDAISNALASIPRSEMVIASKINENDLNTYSVIKACEKILQELKTDYLDILFIHHPLIGELNQILDEMLMLKQKKLICSIGISNFNVKYLNVVNHYLDVIDVNQIEVHPFLFQQDIYCYCKQFNIQIMAYRPFASNLILHNKTLQQIGEKNTKTPYQVVLRWLLQMGFQVIPKATSYEHLKENIEAFNFELLPEDIDKIKQLNKMQRTCLGAWAEK